MDLNQEMAHKIADELVSEINDGKISMPNWERLENQVTKNLQSQATEHLNDIDRQANRRFNQLTTQLNEENRQQFDRITEDYTKQVNQLVSQKMTEITAQDISTSLTVMAKQRIKKAEQLINQAADAINQKKYNQDIERLDTIFTFSLFGLTLAVLATFWFFLLKSIFYDGIWRGFGLSKIFAIVVNLSNNHPYWALFLGFLAVVIDGGAIYLGFVSTVKSWNWLDQIEIPNWLKKFRNR